MIRSFCFDISHPQWHALLANALDKMDKDYLHALQRDPDWLPGLEHLFAAFSLPLSETKYVLLGESPYPRIESANGYAFWDNAVGSLWSAHGLSKEVNKATSLRNWIKMLLVARGALGNEDTSQSAIAQIDKEGLVQTARDFFMGMMRKGIVLLNASLVYSEGAIPYHARHWRPFMQELLEQIALKSPLTQLILFGKIAQMIPKNSMPIGLVSEHPYNVSFITNERVRAFFTPLDLLTYD